MKLIPAKALYQKSTSYKINLKIITLKNVLLNGNQANALICRNVPIEQNLV